MSMCSQVDERLRDRGAVGDEFRAHHKSNPRTNRIVLDDPIAIESAYAPSTLAKPTGTTPQESRDVARAAGASDAGASALATATTTQAGEEEPMHLRLSKHLQMADQHARPRGGVDSAAGIGVAVQGPEPWPNSTED